MSEKPTNRVPEQLRQIRAVVDETREEIADPKLRMPAVEAMGSQGSLTTAQPNAMQAHAGRIEVPMGSYRRRTDRLETRSGSVDDRLARTGRRLNRIEDQLRLTDA
ncbi:MULTISPECIES: hypothetical protein [unclassified Roseitalea]|uniref:hypothetical protein n=1 Tax=unclassified Roseitalea TaxID=2639107 RepID=UPI00273E1EEB|nr:MULTISPECIES: hypothetical protein [unclassified Roseitalea]